MNEVVENKNNELVTQEELEYLIWFDEQEKRAKVIKDKLRNDGHDFLERNNLMEEGYKVSYDGATLHLYETKPYKKKQVDTKRLKEEGLYDLYTHDVWVKGSVRIQIEYEDED